MADRTRGRMRLASIVLMMAAFAALVAAAVWRVRGPRASDTPPRHHAAGAGHAMPSLPSNQLPEGFVVAPPGAVPSGTAAGGARTFVVPAGALPADGSPIRLLPVGDAEDPTREGELVRAAFEGDLERVRELLDEGLPPDTRDANKRGPLHRAAEAGALAVVETLVEAGADIEMPDATHQTPLTWAAMRAHPEVVRYLVSRGADPDPQFAPVFVTPLGQLAFKWFRGGEHISPPDLDPVNAPPERWIATARALLTAGANPNLRSQGSLPIQQAVPIGNADFVALLIEHGADAALVPHLREHAGAPGPIGALLEEAFEGR